MPVGQVGNVGNLRADCFSPACADSRGHPLGRAHDSSVRTKQTDPLLKLQLGNVRKPRCTAPKRGSPASICGDFWTIVQSPPAESENRGRAGPCRCTGREWICDGILLTIMRSIRRTPACGLAAALLVGSLAFAQLRPAQFVEPLQFPTALPDPGWPIAASGDSTTTGTKILSLPTARRFM